MADRYINANKLLEEIDYAISNIAFSSPYQNDIHAMIEGMKRVRDRVEESPTADVVEVVRCKDCGSYNKHYGECTLNGSYFGENGYCCQGVRTLKKGGREQ